MNSNDIKKSLAERYDMTEGWVTMDEVSPPKCSRRLDAISISVFQSHPLQIHGFEIKTSRSDWLRELADQTKAGELMRYCTHYWLVAPIGVAEEQELPPGWGLMRATEGEGGKVTLRAAKRAPTWEVEPEAWGPAFWRCMLLRLRTRTPVTPEEIKAAAAEGYQRGLNDNSWKSLADANQHDSARLAAIVGAFARGSGLWCTAATDEKWEQWGRMVRNAGGLDLLHTADVLDGLARETERRVSQIQREASKIRALAKREPVEPEGEANPVV